jgi:hypothetical protein
MYFCDLLETGVNRNNWEAAVHVVLTACTRGQSAGAVALQSPAVPSTEQERLREISHAAVEIVRLPGYFPKLSTLPSPRRRARR